MDNEIKRIWAPWRMAYIEGSTKDSGCIFCNKPKLENDRDNLILHRGQNCFVMMNLFPYVNGHLMVAPYKHTGCIEELNDEEMLEIMQCASSFISIFKKISSPNGFNLGFNIGRAAGAGIEDHIHFHIVPRWIGDTNFMPVLSETRIISEHIFQTYDKIKDEVANFVKHKEEDI